MGEHVVNRPASGYRLNLLVALGLLCVVWPSRAAADEIPAATRDLAATILKEAGDQRAPHPSSDWPTWRHDNLRSGYTETPVPAELKQAWQAQLGGKLFVASVNEHAVRALDALTGERLWSFTAGGRVDSPPTYHRGSVLFGSADGFVYCLRAADGALAWRFRVAPADRRTVAYEQVESLWPLHGSVLVQDGVAYCLAGRPNKTRATQAPSARGARKPVGSKAASRETRPTGSRAPSSPWRG